MTDAMAHQLHDLWQAARSAWPGVEVAEHDFARHLLERVDGPDDDAAFGGINSGDLYLACACARRVPRALETFEHALLAHVPRFVAALDPSRAVADDVQQAMRERLFMGSDERPPKILQYQGRGSLLGWLRVMAARVTVDLARVRGARAEVSFDDAQPDTHDLELSLVKAQHRQEFEDAVRAALQGLPRRDRNLIRLHLVGGVSTHKLAAMYHVGQSSIVRTLAAVRTAIREAVRTRLVERLGVSTGELDSLAGVLLSRLDLSLAGCLRSEG